MIVLAELHDFRRFTSPRDLMSYLGLTPSEYSSSDRKRRGAITKAGNSHVRRVLVEAAHNYRFKPAVKGTLKQRREGQPAAVIAIADKAQQRLHKRYFKLKEGYRKPHNVAVVAVARELVGFIWAILNHRTRCSGGGDFACEIDSDFLLKLTGRSSDIFAPEGPKRGAPFEGGAHPASGSCDRPTTSGE